MDKYLKLNSVKFGLAWGIVAAICVFLTTLLALTSYFQSYTQLATTWLIAIYGGFGYSVGGIGAVLGAVYAGIDTFAASWIFALIYNNLL